MEEMRAILVDEASELFDRTGMFYKKFPSDFREIRYFTLLILQKAPPEMKEINLLEQQISELIKNAVKHGNRKDPGTMFQCGPPSTSRAPGSSCRTRGRASGDWRNGTSSTGKGEMTASVAEDFEEMAQFVSYVTPDSDDHDGGNALFAAVEYWTRGWSSMRRRTAWPPKRFPHKRHGIALAS